MREKATKTASRTSQGFILGRAGFEKISTVEGIRFSTDLKKPLHDLDREDATAAQRRRLIARKYGKE
jgi:hypothetical protein